MAFTGLNVKCLFFAKVVCCIYFFLMIVAGMLDIANELIEIFVKIIVSLKDLDFIDGTGDTR